MIHNEHNNDYSNSLSIVSNIVQWSAVKNLVQVLAVKLSAAVSESGSSLLGSDVALRLCHHLVTNQELAHSSAAKKRRIEVDVEVASIDLLGSAFEWCLVKTHACSTFSIFFFKGICFATYCRGIEFQRGCRSVW